MKLCPKKISDRDRALLKLFILLADHAMADPIPKIDEEPHKDPKDELEPNHLGQDDHLSDTSKNPSEGDPREERNLEGTMKARLLIPEEENSKANNCKSEESSH